MQTIIRCFRWCSGFMAWLGAALCVLSLGLCLLFQVSEGAVPDVAATAVAYYLIVSLLWAGFYGVCCFGQRLTEKTKS